MGFPPLASTSRGSAQQNTALLVEGEHVLLPRQPRILVIPTRCIRAPDAISALGRRLRRSRTPTISPVAPNRQCRGFLRPRGPWCQFMVSRQSVSATTDAMRYRYGRDAQKRAISHAGRFDQPSPVMRREVIMTRARALGVVLVSAALALTSACWLPHRRPQFRPLPQCLKAQSRLRRPRLRGSSASTTSSALLPAGWPPRDICLGKLVPHAGKPDVRHLRCTRWRQLVDRCREAASQVGRLARQMDTADA